MLVRVIQSAILAISVTLSINAQTSPELVEKRIVGQLTSSKSEDTSNALAALADKDKATLSAEIKMALVDALERESDANRERYWRSMRGEATAPHPHPDLVSALERAVAESADPHAIPVMADALGGGFTLIHALARFGTAAAGDLIRVTMSQDTPHYAVDHGLITLRMIVELAGGPDRLDPKLRAELVEVARYHLTRKPRFVPTVRWALDLAAVLADPGLRAHLERFANDPAAAEELGATDREDVVRTQQRAANLLVGMPPQPRPPLASD